MDFVKFAHNRNRMCNAQRGQGEGCKGCPLDQIMDRKSVCSVWCFQNPEKAIEAVEQWAAEHPVKTRQSEFLTMFPGADVGETDGCLTLNPCHFYKKMQLECSGRKCSDCRKAFWLAEVE
nr:MAG TPA: hypothetical protein [Caudoviricetes sp.]